MIKKIKKEEKNCRKLSSQQKAFDGYFFLLSSIYFKNLLKGNYNRLNFKQNQGYNTCTTTKLRM